MMLATRSIRRVVVGALAATTLFAGSAKAVTFNVDNVNLTNGFMNVFELPSNGGGYIFGSGWGIADLNATFAGGNWTLSPNTIGDPNPFWYTPSGGPGAAGNKVMEANLYSQFTGSLAGQTVTFIGNVVSNTLTSAHVGKIFIRDFAPDFSSVVEQSIPMPAAGNFSISLATINDPNRHVQYGFQLKGECVWYTDTAPFGNVVIGPQSVTPSQKSSWSRVKSLYR
ncbi:MAG: hypothetical protein ACKOC6_06275 [bacterium]